MPRSTTVRLSALALVAAAALSACGSDAPAAAPLTQSTATSTAPEAPTDAPTDSEPPTKLEGENLLGWKDYSGLGIKGLTVRWAAKPGQATMSQCESSDMRDAAGRVALWQSSSESKGDVLAGQQIASFESQEEAEAAFEALATWNKDCVALQQESADVELDGNADGTYWKRTISEKRGEVVTLTRIGKRVSFLAVSGATDAVAMLDPEAILLTTAVKLG